MLHPNQATKALSSGAFLLLTVQSWAVHFKTEQSNCSQGQAVGWLRVAHFIREFTSPIHYVALQTAVPMQQGNGKCPSQEQRTCNHAPTSGCRCTLPTPHKAVLGILETQRNSKHQNSSSLLVFQAKQQWEPTYNSLSSENQSKTWKEVTWSTSLHSDYFSSFHSHIKAAQERQKPSTSWLDFYIMGLFKHQPLPSWLWKGFAKVNRTNTLCQGTTLTSLLSALQRLP